MRSFVASLGVPVVLVAAIGCSSGSFEVASPIADVGGVDAAIDGGATDVGADEVGVIDGGLSDVGGSEAGAGDAGNGCKPVAVNGDLYVDSNTVVKTPNGSEGCPFPSIVQAVDVAADSTGARVIHVQGGSSAAARLYAEPALIKLRAGLTLVADTGPSSVRITGKGSCTAATQTFPCVMQMEPGSTLDGFVVDAAGPRDAIVATAGGADSVVIKNSGVTGASAELTIGLRAYGSLVLGPGFQAQNNARDGVHTFGAGTIRVVAGGKANLFSKNGGSGLNLEGGVLVLTNAVASDNGVYGVRIASSTAGTHTLDGLEARNNVDAGVYVESAASIKMRSSALTGNKIGLLGRNGAANFIDLGSPASLGNNVFGGKTAKNTVAGICFANVRDGGGSADGNSWATCPPSVSVVSIPCTFTGATPYADAYVHGLTGGATPSAPAGCKVGG